VACLGQRILGEFGRQIDHRASHARDGDPTADGRVFGNEVAGAMRPDSLNASLGGGDDFRRRSWALDQSPEMCGRAPTEERPVARRKDGRQVGGFDARCPVPDAIDPRVLAQEGSRAQPRCDLPARYSGAKQLFAGRHPVRGVHDSSEFFFDCPVQGTDLVP
jgi:hypothetical protein